MARRRTGSSSRSSTLTGDLYKRPDGGRKQLLAPASPAEPLRPRAASEPNDRDAVQLGLYVGESETVYDGHPSRTLSPNEEKLPRGTKVEVLEVLANATGAVLGRIEAPVAGWVVLISYQGKRLFTCCKPLVEDRPGMYALGEKRSVYDLEATGPRKNSSKRGLLSKASHVEVAEVYRNPTGAVFGRVALADGWVVLVAHDGTRNHHPCGAVREHQAVVGKRLEVPGASDSKCVSHYRPGFYVLGATVPVYDWQASGTAKPQARKLSEGTRLEVLEVATNAAGAVLGRICDPVAGWIVLVTYQGKRQHRRHSAGEAAVRGG